MEYVRIQHQNGVEVMKDKQALKLFEVQNGLGFFGSTFGLLDFASNPSTFGTLNNDSGITTDIVIPHDGLTDVFENGHFVVICQGGTSPFRFLPYNSPNITFLFNPNKQLLSGFQGAVVYLIKVSENTWRVWGDLADAG